ncbi:ankyrin-3-like [Neltuma alba]|uniref:ankyrin-3-like n=1 Tax=Neltuma alba TaxID=207710 RepID=UPI0010A5972F|nr:ankyrin-3-like [Prosopis alba]
MMMLVSPGSGIRRQVFPINYETEVSQRLIDAAHNGDTNGALECIANPFVDVNFIGTVNLKCRTTEIVLHDQSPHEVRFGYEEFKTEVTALFLAAHTGNLILLRKLLNVGGDVNERLFRGYAITAAVREGHREVVEILINAGASQAACEEALMEASLLDWPIAAELLMESNMIRPHVAVHALVSASCRGFTHLVRVLLKHGVDANAIDRTLLQSSKPFLHANVHCNALFAAVVSRQIDVVRLLLQVGIRTDIEAKLGAWAWETDTGEEFRVGAGLAEAYPITWCAVEYFEARGAILSMLLHHLSPNILHFGRSLLHHAILCENEKAVNVILNSGANTELPVHKKLYAIHLAARLGSCNILRFLLDAGCNFDSQTQYGDSALMISTRHKHEDCLKVLVSAGADLGLLNSSGQSVMSIARSVKWMTIFQKAILDLIRGGKVVKSSNASVFSALIFATRSDDVEALKELIGQRNINIDEQDENGFSAAMIAVAEGKAEAFRLLLKVGADVLKLRNKHNLTALDLINQNKSGKAFEKIMLEFALEKGFNDVSNLALNPLHHAARHGDTNLVHKLIKKGFDVNTFNNDGYTPLMLAARESQSDEMCKLLISCGAKCDIENERHETALSLARKNRVGNYAERVILDELARKRVLCGALVKKHTRCGKGSPHTKELRMVESGGTLRWGKSSGRNVVCKAAEIGASDKFRWNRRRKYDVDEPGLFHVVTTKNKEFHFVCGGGVEMAELWVRGIKLVSTEAIFGRN